MLRQNIDVFILKQQHQIAICRPRSKWRRLSLLNGSLITTLENDKNYLYIYQTLTHQLCYRFIQSKKNIFWKERENVEKKRFTIQTRIFWFDKKFSWMFCVHSFSFKAISTCFSLNLLAAARWFIIYLILIDLNGRENTKCKHNRSVDTHMHRICTCTCNSIRSTQRPNPTFIHFWIIRYVAHVQLWSPLNTCDFFYCYYFVLICAKICAEDKAHAYTFETAVIVETSECIILINFAFFEANKKNYRKNYSTIESG